MIIQGIRYASDFEAKKLMIEIGKSLDEKGYTLRSGWDRMRCGSRSRIPRTAL